MERGKVIDSVNILDLRRATEASVKEYEAIRSVNLVVYSTETAQLLHRLPIGSVNATAEVSPDVKFELVMGPLQIGADHFKNLVQPLGLLVMGPITVAPDLRPEDLDSGLAAGMVMGSITVPEPLAAILQSKLQLVMGPVESYPLFEKMHTGALTLNATYLQKLNDKTELAVVGSLRCPEAIPSDLIRRKLGKLHVTGQVRCFQENAPDLQAVLTGTSGSVHAIPNGFKVIDDEIRLTRDLLLSISDRKLYFARTVVIDADIDGTLLSQKIEALVCQRTVICPQALQASLGRVCDLLNTKAAFYEGDLWLIDGETELRPSRFDYLDAKVSLVVTGVLKVDENIAPDVLASRIAIVHHYGVIECSPEQQAAIESRTGVSEGVFVGPQEASETSGHRLESANYLAL